MPSLLRLAPAALGFSWGHRLPGKKLAHKLEKHSKVSRPECSCPASLDTRTRVGRGGPDPITLSYPDSAVPWRDLGLSKEQHLYSTVSLCDPGLHYRDSRFENI